MRKIIEAFLFCCVFAIKGSVGQEAVMLEMEKVIALARTSNLAARRAMVERQNARWNMLIHRANLRPQLLLEATLPDYSHSMMPVTQSDGAVVLKPVSLSRSGAALKLKQPVAAWGAEFFVNTNLFRYDNFRLSDVSYGSIPVEAGVTMPLFGYRDLLWEKRLAPLEFHEQARMSDWNIEISVMRAIELFFDYLIDRHNYQRAGKNSVMNQELYRITCEKYERGTVSHDDVLQIRLMMINAVSREEAERVAAENSLMRLLSHLSLEIHGEVLPVIPVTQPQIMVDGQYALQLAHGNNPNKWAFQRQLMEAQRDRALVKGGTGLSGQLFASIGLTSSFEKPAQYGVEQDGHALVQVGITVPIIDWGRTRSARKQAAVNEELVNTMVLQQKADFDREVLSLANITSMLNNRLETVMLADTIANHRWEIAHNRFLAGDISVMELNLAQQENDMASYSRLTCLRDFWVSYHKLCAMTLYDFIDNKPLWHDEADLN